jgi:hypothetical protein
MMRKKQSLAIKSTAPFLGVPGGKLFIDCRGFTPDISSKVFFGEVEAAIVSASEDRVVVRLPESPNCLGLTLKNENSMSEVFLCLLHHESRRVGLPGHGRFPGRQK